MIRSPNRSGRSAYWVKVKNPKAPAAKAKLGKIDGASTLAPQQAKISVDFCCDAANRARQTFTLSSFLNDENSVSAWPGARGHHEEPLSHCPRRGGARHRQHPGGHEQRLQEQPTCVVRSDVQHAAPHKKWLSLAVNPEPPHRQNRTPSLIFDQIAPRAGWAGNQVTVDTKLLTFNPQLISLN